MTSMITPLLDLLPTWMVFLMTVAFSWLSVEAGYLFADFWRRRGEKEKEGPIAAMEAAMLGLLAFVLTFTFGMAASRFDARRELVLDEANAIGTAYLRAQMLPTPSGAEIQRLLRDYVKTRLEAIQPGKLEGSIAKSEQLHNLLWAQTVAVARDMPNSTVLLLFVQSMNEVIDLHQKRLTIALRNRIPASIWDALYLVAGITMISMGYYLKVTDSQRSIATVALSVSFSVVILLIVGLDRPQAGLIEVSQQALIDTQKSMSVSTD